MPRNQNFPLPIKIYFFISLLVGVAYADPSPPEWIHQQDRIVIGGDILHLGIGVGETPEVARFKSEAMSVRVLISECTLAHRDIVIWDRYMEQKDGQYIAYTRAGLSFESCHEAKSARGEKRKQMSNSELINNQDIYSQLEGLNPSTFKNSSDIKRNTKDIAILKRQRLDNQNKIKALEEKIIQLEREKSDNKSQTIVIKETKILYDKAPANQARFEDCMQDYRQLMNDANQAALEIGNPKGNLASPGVYPKLNRAEAKLRYCQQIKGN